MRRYCASFQDLEYDLIIFIAGRELLSNGPVFQASLLDILRDLYVMTTRARFNLVINGSIDFLYVNCNNWNVMVDDFQLTHNA